MANKNTQRKPSFLKYVRNYFVAPGDSASFASLIKPNGVDYGVTVNRDAALRFTAVFAAIKILAENVAALPKSIMRSTAAGLVEASEHPSSHLLTVAPNEYTDRFTFWFAMIASVLGEGNAFAVIKYKDYVADSLHFVPACNVKVKLINGHKMYVVFGLVGEMEFLNGTYEDWEMVHVMYFSVDGIRGIDPITYNAAAIGRGIATQKFSAEFYKKGGNIKAVMETDGHMGDDEYDAFMRHFSQSSGNYDTPLLEYGIKYKSIGISPVAAQLIQSEVLSIQDIARIFSIPPHLLAELSHATFSNIEQQNIFFAVYSLRPLCKRIEEQLELKLFSDAERGEYSVKFDLKGMMRGDDAARAAYYTQGINAGWLTPNEARGYEGLASLPGLDAARVPLNTAYVDEAGKIVNPNND